MQLPNLPCKPQTQQDVTSSNHKIFLFACTAFLGGIRMEILKVGTMSLHLPACARSYRRPHKQRRKVGRYRGRRQVIDTIPKPPEQRGDRHVNVDGFQVRRLRELIRGAHLANNRTSNVCHHKEDPARVSAVRTGPVRRAAQSCASQDGVIR